MKNKTYAQVELKVNDKVLVRIDGNFKEEEVMLLDDLISIIFHTEPADKKALKIIKETVSKWNKDMAQ